MPGIDQIVKKAAGIDGKELSKELQQLVINGGFLDCKDFHDGTCLHTAFARLVTTFSKAYKYYIPIHLIPLLIFKRKKLVSEPGQTISRAFYNYVKSVLFIALYVALCKYFLCKFKNIRGKVDGWNPSLAASFASVALFLESESRRQEISLFVLPKFFETAWRLLRKRGYVKDVQGWELLVFGLAMGIINVYYQHEENAIKSTYLSVFKKFWGKD